MANVKTAISVNEPLFVEINELAHEMSVSRSHLISLAAQEFIQRRKSHKLFNAINDAYDDLPDKHEEVLKLQMRSRHLELVKDQW